ncbi:MAG TPA: hypothetical protein VH560_01095 [Polyangia bacterium]|jgi:hypothetical protein|nr:hypothetical protein [Polyangia bacterium]
MLRAPLFSSPSLRNLLAPITFGIALAGGAFGCSSSSSSCAVTFAGGVAESGTVAAGCGTLTLASADAGAPTSSGYDLAFTASSAHVINLEIDINLGAAPAVGMFSSDTITAWSVVGLAMNGCPYGAGPEAVPVGSFMLNLTDVSKATPPVVHGTLDMTMYVHPPAMTDCGPTETESVLLTF